MFSSPKLIGLGHDFRRLVPNFSRMNLSISVQTGRNTQLRIVSALCYAGRLIWVASSASTTATISWISALCILKESAVSLISLSTRSILLAPEKTALAADDGFRRPSAAVEYFANGTISPWSAPKVTTSLFTKSYMLSDWAILLCTELWIDRGPAWVMQR